MLQVTQLSKTYGLDPILEDINFTLNPGDRFGLVGINGTGKTTLIRIIVGEETPDKGAVNFFPQTLPKPMVSVLVSSPIERKRPYKKPKISRSGLRN